MSFPVDEAARIRDYLRKEAAAHSIEELIGLVEEGAAELDAAANALPESELGDRPEPESWAPLECLSHVVQWNVISAQQVLWVALSGELPAEEEVALPPDRRGLLDLNRNALDSLYVHVREADPMGFVETTWQHPFFGDLNWREWLLFLRLHCRDHARQLASMRSA